MSKSSNIVELARIVAELMKSAMDAAKGTQRRKIYFLVLGLGATMFVTGAVSMFFLD